MRAALVLAGLTVATTRPALAAVGTVKCCLEAAIDDAPPRRACIVLNVRARTRPKARARRQCRVIGGRPVAQANR